MSANQWEAIDFESVSSVAMRIHGRPQRAFERNAPEQFAAWKAKIATGEARVKGMKVLQPHEIVAQYLERKVVDVLLEAQWKALVDGLDSTDVDTLQHTLVIVIPSDVLQLSTSERQLGAVAIALALLTDFQDRVLKARPEPELQAVTGATLFERVQCMKRIVRARGEVPSAICCFTRAFRAILAFAKSHSVRHYELPRRLVAVLSADFELAGCSGFEANYRMLQQEFADADYAMPHLVFWNVNGSISSEQAGLRGATMLVSGFSIANFKRVLHGCSLSLLETMLEATGSSQYDAITLPSRGRSGGSS